MQRADTFSPSLALLLLLLLTFFQGCPGSRISAAAAVPQCDPSRHICEGPCPPMPAVLQPPSDGWGSRGVCLRDAETGACVCWLRNEDEDKRHLQTLFKCQVPLDNGGVRHVMCFPPAHCFVPGVEWGCMIVPHCPCADHRSLEDSSFSFGRWHPVVALLLRSQTPVARRDEDEGGGVSAPTSSSGAEKEGRGEESEKKSPEGGGSSSAEDAESSSSREFSLRHLLFLVAFVVAPLLCWCTLTFFNGSRCCRFGTKMKRRAATDGEEEEEEEEEQQMRLMMSLATTTETRPPLPSAPPKPTECLLPPPPPSYEAAAAVDAGGGGGGRATVVVVVDCGAPPPPYEDAVREERHRWRTNEEKGEEETAS